MSYYNTLTHLCQALFLEPRVRFELTILRICNPLHLTTLPSRRTIIKCYLPICQNVANTDKRMAVISGPVPRTVRPV